MRGPIVSPYVGTHYVVIRVERRDLEGQACKHLRQQIMAAHASGFGARVGISEQEELTISLAAFNFKPTLVPNILLCCT